MVASCSIALTPYAGKASNAARRAKQMGYGYVHVMSAGITGWVSARMPTEQGAPSS